MFETIILSAGQSSRMGSDKALLDIDGLPAIVHIIKKVITISDCIYIVLGDNLQFVKSKVNEYFQDSKKILFIHNELHKKGMFSSVQKGFASLKKGKAIIFQLIDQPFISQNVYEKLVSKYDPANLITQPSFVENQIKRGGHPLIFSPEFRDIVLSYPIDFQLNKVIDDHKESRKFIEFNDESILQNLNTKKDFKKHLKG